MSYFYTRQCYRMYYIRLPHIVEYIRSNDTSKIYVIKIQCIKMQTVSCVNLVFNNNIWFVCIRISFNSTSHTKFIVIHLESTFWNEYIIETTIVIVMNPEKVYFISYLLDLFSRSYYIWNWKTTKKKFHLILFDSITEN